mgnify:CR=1 FL=1
MQAIEVKSVTKAYGEVTALRDVTVSFGEKPDLRPAWPQRGGEINVAENHR